MSTSTETEPRAPQSDAEPSTGKSAADRRRMSTALSASEGLKRLATWFPEEVSHITKVDHEGLERDRLYDIYTKLNEKMTESGYDLIADVAELVQNWTPAGDAPRPGNMSDIHERAAEVAAIIGGLRAVEYCYRNHGVDKDEVDEYFNSACGIVRAAQRAIANLQELLSATPAPPTEGGAA